ncbi:MAG: phosphoenolpyruvate carboxykinase (ATP), partial [Planctomycetaceae bacterium]|nr:phosphoenolpyruvate carboxykinase (ATP) [Planctomycetaceae bacterium]
MCLEFDLSSYGIRVPHLHNASPAILYEEALSREKSVLASSGALITSSGQKTGRSPKDKRIVKSQPSSTDIWWGDINLPMTPDDFDETKARAVDYLNTRDLIYVVDGYAGWEPKHRLKIRVICCRAYHALFMANMLIRPENDELSRFGTPDFVIYNAGQFPANPKQKSVGSQTCVAFERGEFVILGTQYAGKMKNKNNYKMIGTRSLIRHFCCIIMCLMCSVGTVFAKGELPQLVGDGVADDTKAIQALLDSKAKT